jgi:hypothetical protein
MNRQWGALGLVVLALVGAGRVSAAVFTVTNEAPVGPGSFAAAIAQGNQTPGPDRIEFNIPSPTTIQLTLPLPVITDPVTIDGYTQPGSAVNTTAVGTNAIVRVTLSGALMSDANGLELGDGSGGSVIRGVRLISFKRQGSLLGAGVAITGTSNAGGSRIEGCIFSVNVDGQTLLRNLGPGILVNGGGSGTQIGGLQLAQRNMISGNGAGGIQSYATGVSVQNNLIGVGKNAVTALGNTGDGVVFEGDQVVIGGDGAAGNLIANNTGAGIAVCPLGLGEIRGNALRANGGLGLDLAEGDCTLRGPTPNDPGDADGGANGLQNAPELIVAGRRPVAPTQGDVLVRGELQSRPSRFYRIELFASASADPSGYGEGENPVGTFEVGTGADGYAYFTHVLPARSDLAVGQVLTATATELVSRTTSEFSNAVAIDNQLTVTSNADSGPGSLRQALIDANSNPNRDLIAFAIPGSGPHTIVPLTQLPALVTPATIDGYTHGAARPNSAEVGSNAVLTIRLLGSASQPMDGIQLEPGSEASIVRGLAIGGMRAQGGLGGVAIRASNSVVNGFHRVEGNYVGTLDGLSAAQNEANGLRIEGQNGGHRVGSTARRDRNLISGNRFGLVIGRSVVVENNLIGVARDGSTPLPNLTGGVAMAGFSSRVGGTAPGAGNVIAYNDLLGVGVVGVGSVANRVVGNRIYGTTAPFPNTGIGIDLDANASRGVTPNDLDDLDDGANERLNFPVLLPAVAGTTLALPFTADTRPDHVGSAYTIDVYSSAECDATGHGEGEHYLGSVPFIPQPAESYAVQLPARPPAGDLYLSATIADFTGNTSEFSACQTWTLEDLMLSDSFE